jgi:RES domain-containing protein
MNVFRITKCRFIQDLSGNGAYLSGGRWNSEGNYVLYTASTASLAMLETLAHLETLPDGYCLAAFSVPDEDTLVYNAAHLPENWHVFPAPASLRAIGDRLIRQGKYLSIQFPSALLPEDKVILLNPRHPKFHLVKVEYQRVLDISERLYKKAEA